MRVTQNVKEDGVYEVPQGLLEIAAKSLDEYDLSEALLVKDENTFYFKLPSGTYVEAEDAKAYFRDLGLNYRNVDELGLREAACCKGCGDRVPTEEERATTDVETRAVVNTEKVDESPVVEKPEGIDQDLEERVAANEEKTLVERMAEEVLVPEEEVVPKKVSEENIEMVKQLVEEAVEEGVQKMTEEALVPEEVEKDLTERLEKNSES